MTFCGKKMTLYRGAARLGMDRVVTARCIMLFVLKGLC